MRQNCITTFNSYFVKLNSRIPLTLHVSKIMLIKIPGHSAFSAMENKRTRNMMKHIAALVLNPNQSFPSATNLDLQE